MQLLALAFVLSFAGCINGEYNTDAAAPTPDMAQPKIYDLAGLDLYGAYNCSGLNTCEKNCMTKACIYMCRNMATPQAVDKEIALQSCFVMFCPTGSGQVCDASSGSVSAACNTCIANTYIANGASCSATQLPSECHQCVAQANACTSDM